MTEDAEYLEKILPELAKEMSFKWRVQSFSKFKPEATCVAYVDARGVMDRLDKVCLYGWDRDHKEIKGHVYAGIGIVLPSGRISWRWDCGVESNVDAEKGEASDSFKRAAVNWKIGRFLYDLKIKKLPANEKKGDGKFTPKIVDGNGKWVDDLTEYINGLGKVEEVREVLGGINVMEFDEMLEAAKDKKTKRGIWDAHWAEVKPMCADKELVNFKQFYEKEIKK